MNEMIGNNTDVAGYDNARSRSNTYEMESIFLNIDIDCKLRNYCRFDTDKIYL